MRRDEVRLSMLPDSPRLMFDEELRHFKIDTFLRAHERLRKMGKVYNGGRRGIA